MSLFTYLRYSSTDLSSIAELEALPLPLFENYYNRAYSIDPFQSQYPLNQRYARITRQYHIYNYVFDFNSFHKNIFELALKDYVQEIDNEHYIKLEKDKILEDLLVYKSE